MRTEEEIKDRIELAIIEEINKKLLCLEEPENSISQFIQNLTNSLTEITLDEIEFRRRY